VFTCAFAQLHAVGCGVPVSILCVPMWFLCLHCIQGTLGAASEAKLGGKVSSKAAGECLLGVFLIQHPSAALCTRHHRVSLQCASRHHRGGSPCGPGGCCCLSCLVCTCIFFSFGQVHTADCGVCVCTTLWFLCVVDLAPLSSTVHAASPRRLQCASRHHRGGSPCGPGGCCCLLCLVCTCICF
jgi:hypothetical protein